MTRTVSVVVESCALLLLASTWTVVAEAPRVRAQTEGRQAVEMTAKKYEFSPTVHVKKGTSVELKVTAIDHDHGLDIATVPDGAAADTPPGLVFESPERCWKVKKGQTVTIDFLAQTPGTYTIKCCVDCGLGHRHMRGQIVVEE
jgi:heme/copper-type cytochrome/quinol oxidase subunit 2